jgi:hypothetical protein
LLAIGKFRRLAALALIGSLIPTTLAGHRFWEEADEAKRAQQQIHFLKNLGLLGGLILAAVDTEGAPSLGWKARRRARRMATALTVGHAMADVHAHRSISKASGGGRKAGRRANRAAHKIPQRANDAATDAARHANVATSQALTTGTAIAAPFVRHANETVLSAAKTAAEVAGPFISAGVERAGDSSSSVLPTHRCEPGSHRRSKSTTTGLGVLATSGLLLLVATKTLTHGREHLVGKVVSVSGGEAGVQRGGEHRCRDTLVNGRDGGPPPLP